MKFIPSMPNGNRFCSALYLQMPLLYVNFAWADVAVVSLKLFGTGSGHAALLAAGTRRVFL